MAYFKINNVDFSGLVKAKGLQVTRSHNYNAQTNAAGDTVIDYINAKRSIKVDFIIMTGAQLQTLLAQLNELAVTIQYREPRSGVLETANCIAPKVATNYYTIQSAKTLVEGFSVTFTEL